jgi:hypothetical protein
MRFTKRSIRWRRALERKKELVEILGGKVAATHGTAEVPMRHAAPQAKPLTPPLSPQELARRAYARRRAECETMN